MSTPFRIMVFLIVAMATIPSSVKSINPRKLDDTTNPAGSPNDTIKCGSCPCGTTCYSSPPPSPSPPSPPPKKPSPSPSSKYPPPPSGSGGSGQAPPNYIYISGPPGDVYPVVQSISEANRRFTVAPVIMVVFGLLGMLAFW